MRDSIPVAPALALVEPWEAEEADMEVRALHHERDQLAARLHYAGNRLETALLSKPVRLDLIEQVRNELGYHAGRLTRQGGS